MNRLQKKCLFASATTHVLLFGVLVVGPAFQSPRNPADDLPPLEMVPDRLIDEPFQGGGGKPDAKPLAPAPAPPPPAVINPPARKPEPEPPAPEPVVTKPVAKPAPEPEPAKPEPDPEDVPEKVVKKSAKPEKPVNTTPKPVRKPVKVNLEVAKRSNADLEREAQAKAKAEVKARADAAERARITGERRALWSSTVRGLSTGLSATGMSVEMPGPGGEAYANYRQFVKSKYDWAWVVPESLSEDNATVSVRVIISRDGTVKRSEITSRSGIPALDKSVQETLNRVRSIGYPFPEGAKEQEREFRLNFKPKPKQSAG